MLSSSSRRPLLLVTIAGLLALGLLLWAALAATPARAATLTVTSAADGGPGSLRQALLDANASPGHDIITFDIESGAQTITLTTVLPVITDSLTLDGTTQDGFTGTPLVELSGALLPTRSAGLQITAGNSTVRGLIMTRFFDGGSAAEDSAAILLRDGGDNTIQGNILGTDVTGMAIDRANGFGVLIVNSSNNTIGGITPEAGNTIYFDNNSPGDAGPTGVAVYSGNGNAILGNSISSSSYGLGITLSAPGASTDDYAPLGRRPDLYDRDTGPNTWQNFPLLYGAVNDSGTLTVTGVVKSTPNATFRVELFETNGEWHFNGKTFLGYVSVTTDADGFGPFTFSRPALAPGASVIATTTDSHNNTSAFSFPLQSGSTYVVTTTADSGPGSLRRAITLANADPDSSLIRFNIGAGAQTIKPASPLPSLLAATVLDATTQPGYAGKPLIELSGTNAGDTDGLRIFSDNVIVKGLAINRFARNGITGGNVIPSLVMIQGNYIGTTRDGMGAAGNGQRGISFFGAAGNGEGSFAEMIIGGTRGRERNVISANNGDGIVYWGVQDLSSWGLAIRGNYVGLNATGTAALGNVTIGISVDEVGELLLGGQAPGAGNVVAGTRLNPIEHNAGQVVIYARRFWIQGNRIGTNAAGTGALPGEGWGLVVGGVKGYVGGTRAGAANQIAYNPLDGIWVQGGTSKVTIRGNAIYANGRLGLNLSTLEPPVNGLTPNDVGDGDSGPNGLQNFPVLTRAAREGASLRVSGTLNSRPNTSYQVDLYANDVLDPSGYGEGRTYLGAITVTTNASGNGTFSGLVRLPPNGQPWITATASHPTNGTSEFSRGLRAALE